MREKQGRLVQVGRLFTVQGWLINASIQNAWLKVNHFFFFNERKF